MMYCIPVFGQGMGFGNRLFPWARCLLFARETGAKMITPIWIRPSIGTLLRGGIDKRCCARQIMLLGLFRKRFNEISFYSGFLKTYKLDSFNDQEIDKINLKEFEAENKVIKFRGYQNFFEPLIGEHDYIYSELIKITHSKYLNLAKTFGSVPIGICVRCGNDLKTANSNFKILPRYYRTPIQWFVKSLIILRKSIGFPVKAVVVSDGTKEQLHDLLTMDNVFFARPGTAISDLLILARSKVLICSGASSFSAWGSFLGQQPSISHLGQSLTGWGIIPSRNQYIGEFDPDHPNFDFLAQAKNYLTDYGYL